MGHQVVADLRVDDAAVVVEQVGLVLVDQVLDAGEVVLFPRERNGASAGSPGRLAPELRNSFAYS